MTLQNVADKADLSLPYVSNLERGHGNPTLESLSRIAKALDTDVATLVGNDELALDPTEVAMAAAPDSLVKFGRSERFASQVKQIAGRQGIDEQALRERILRSMATSPRRSNGEPTEYDWLRLLDAYVRILED